MEIQGAAFVLHKRAYQNSSAIVHFFTESSGRVDAVAKGAEVKSGKSRFNLQCFQLLDIAAKGRSDLLSLHRSESAGSAVVYEGKTLFCALYINELLKELLPKHDAVPEIFSLYKATLSSLTNDTELEVILRSFELQLLDLLGYGISFSDAHTGAALDVEGRYYYYPEQGFVPAGGGGNAIFTGSILNNISAMDFSNSETRKQAKLLLRHVIAHQLGGKPLKSRELFS